MLLWVDELREPPEGWEWAKTITEAIRFLATKEIHSVSMDYDISLLISTGVGPQQEVHSSETFEPVARYIAAAFEEDEFPIKIHSLNTKGQKILADILKGWKVTIHPEKQSDEMSPEQKIISNDKNINHA